MWNFKISNLSKNKKITIIIASFIMVILLGVTTKVPFSLGGPSVDISYMGEVWDGNGDFNKSEIGWYTKWNLEEKIIFNIDFKSETKYSEGSYFDLIITNEDGEEIINFNGKDNNGVNSEKISIISDSENPTTKFQVEIELPDEICKELNFSIKVDEDEVISHGEFTKEFTIKTDIEAPNVNIKDINDGDIFNIANEGEDSSYDINFVVKEENFQDSVVDLIVIKNNKNIEVDESELDWEYNSQKNIYKTSYSLEETGVYKVLLKITDKVGNIGEIEKTFQIANKDEDIYEIIIENEGSNNSNNDIIFSGNIFSLEFTDMYYKFNGNKVENTPENTLNYERTSTGASFNGKFTNSGKYEVFTIINENEETLIETFTVDKTKPVISFGELSDGEIYNIKQESTINVTDEEGNLGNEGPFITITKNGDLVEGISEELTVLENYLFDEGIYVVKVYGKDQAGNTAEETNEEGYKEISFIVDTEAPKLNLTVGEMESIINPEQGETYYFNKNIKIEASVYDTTIDRENGQADITINGTTDTLKEVEYSNNLAIEDGEEEKYTISAYAKDYFDREVAIEEFTIVIDKKLPVITINELSGIYNEEKVLEGVVSDNFLKSATISISENGGRQDKKSLEIINGVATISESFIEGSYEVLIEAEDKLGNVIYKELDFTVDTALPKISIKDVEDSHYYNDDISISIDIEDTTLQTKEVYLSKDGGAYNLITDIEWTDTDLGRKVSTKIDILGNGSYSLKVVGIGHSEVDKTESIINFTIDKNKPMLSIEGFGSGNKDSNEYIHYKDAQHLIVTVKEKNLAIDENGEIKLPNFIVYNVINGTRNDVTASILDKAEWKINEEKDEISLEFDINNLPLENSESEQDIYEIDFSYTDSAELKSQYETQKFIIDSTKPIVSLSGVDKEFNDADKELTITVEEQNFTTNNVTVDCTKDGSEYSIGKWESTNKVSKLTHKFTEEGKYSIKVTSTDFAGNVAEIKELDFTIDKDIPVVSLSGVNNGEYLTEGTIITAIVSDRTLNFDNGNTIIEVIKKDRNGNKLETTTISEASAWKNNKGEQWNSKDKEAIAKVNIPNESGVYTVRISSKDKVENSEVSEKEITFVVDTIDPIITTNGEELEGIYTTDKILNLAIVDTNLKEASVTVTTNGEEEEIPLTIEDRQAGDDLESIALYNKTFDEGRYIVKVKAIDAADRICEKVYEFTIDKKPVDIKIEAVDEYDNVLDLENNKKYNENKKIRITLFDTTLDLNKTTIKVSLDDTEAEVINQWELNDDGRSAVLYYNADKEGDYKFIVTSDDISENTISTKEVNFTIDKTSPIIKIEGITDGSFNQTKVIYDNLKISVTERYFADNEVEIKVTRDSDEPIYLTLDKNTTTSILDINELNKTFKLDGSYVIEVKAIDNAGSIAESKTIQFTVDNIKPIIEYSGIEDYYNNIDKTLIVNIDELNFSESDVKILAEKNGEKYGLENILEGTSFKNMFKEDGKYIITVEATDKAGNISDKNLSFEFVIDKANPKLDISGFTDGNIDDFKYIHYKDTQNLKLTVRDNNLIVDSNNVDIEPTLKIYKIENNKKIDVTKSIVGEENKWNFTKTSEANIDDEIELTFNIDNKLEEGTYEIEFNYMDSALNSTSYKETKVIVDGTKPVVSIVGADNNSFNSENKNVTLSINERNFKTNTINIIATKNGEKYDIGNIKSESDISKLSHNFIEDGYYNLILNSTDKAGNIANKSELAFTIDKTKPNISISGVDNEEHYNINKTINIVVDDNNHNNNEIIIMRSGEVYNAGGFKINGIEALFSHTFSKEGDYEVTVNSTDKANNKSSKIIKFTIDKTAPVITPKFAGQNRVIKNGEYINEIFTPEFTLDKNEDQLTSVILNGTDNVLGRVPISSKEAKYDYKVVAKDKAGNETLLTISYTIDTTKPKLEITGILNGFFDDKLAPKYSISDKNLDNSKTAVTLNNMPYATGTIIEKEGYYTLKAIATDLANNVTSQTIIFAIDKTAPLISFKDPINGKYFTDVIMPELSINDMTDYTIITQTLNGSPYNIGDQITEDGKYVLFLEVQDSAGNISNNTVEFVVDMTKPQFIVSGVEENSQNYNSVTLTVGLNYPTDRIKQMLLNGELVEGRVIEENGEKKWEITVSEIGQYALELIAEDDAGNEAMKTFEFEIAEKTLLTRYFENKPIFYSGIVLVICATIGTIILFLKTRKENEEEVTEE